MTLLTRFVAISIHAPREGSDKLPGCLCGIWRTFQSTLPVRGATKGSARSPSRSTISIHAPREGSDKTTNIVRSMQKISIHAPREGSDQPPDHLRRATVISIHAPREGSDPVPHLDGVTVDGISIHAPREGSDA